MKADAPWTAELETLLERLIEGEFDAAARERLNALLAAGAEQRRYYRGYMKLHYGLEWRIGKANASGQWPVASGQRVRSGEWRVESEIPRPKTQDLRPDFPNPQITTLHSPLSTLHSWAFSYAVATLLLGIALLGAWFSTITHPDSDTFAKNSWRVTPFGDAAKDTPQFTFVGKVSGMVDCQFADLSTETVAGAGVSLGRRYALRSGLMEISYDSGAKVILQGPCDYTVESPRGGFLRVGKLVARVDSAKPQAAVASSENPKSQIPNQQIPNPQSLIPNPLFAVRTPTATVEDLGTEFGVEVLASGETASHVFQGRVVMRTEGAGDGGRGTGDDKSEIQHPTSEILLSAGQSARVERDAKSGEVKLLSGEKSDPSAQSKYVRRLREPPKQLDLLDIVAGGNGTGKRRQRGIDPSDGRREFTYRAYYPNKNHQYNTVDWHPMIDGVFIPVGGDSPVQLDSNRHVFAGFPATSGTSFGSIWARSAEAKSYEDKYQWVYVIGTGERYMPEKRGLLGLHANAGITFDLQAMRRVHSGVAPRRFRATAGMADAPDVWPDAQGMADLWIFVDGQLKWKRIGLRTQDGPVPIEVQLAADARFLTLGSTDGGNESSCDWVVFGDPVLDMSATQQEETQTLEH